MLIYILANYSIFYSSSLTLFTNTANTRSPAQGTMLEAIPTLRPAYWEMIPVTHGIMIAPLLAAGSMTPILVALVILPALATAVGFMPAMAKAKANSSRIAGIWLPAIIMPR